MQFLACALVLALAGCGADTPSADAPRELDREGIYLVPLDGSPRDRLAAVGDRLGEIYDAPVTVLPGMESGIDATDRERRQLVGDAVVRRLRLVYPACAARAAVIGVTDEDTYWSGAPLARLLWNVGPVSEDPRSAARISIRGLDDLDAMTPFVCPDRPQQQQAC